MNIGITPGQLKDFFALAPAGFCPEIELQAERCVSQFDQFRSPLPQADIDRRNPKSLTESQQRNLLDWGYRYVFEGFRFHLTLTGPVPLATQQTMRDELESRFAKIIGKKQSVSHLALFAEPEPGEPFSVCTSRHLSNQGRNTLADPGPITTAIASHCFRRQPE